MNKLLFIRFALAVFLMGPTLSIANTELKSSNFGITTNMHIGQANTACHTSNLQGAIELLHTGPSFALKSLLNYICDTLVATCNLVIGVVGYAFLNVGSVLANNVAK